MSVRQVYVLVEGQTEERIVQQIFQPALAEHGAWLIPVVLKTRRTAGGPHHRGGVSKWSKIEPEIRALLRNPAADLVTTMLDFYGLPTDAPGRADMPAGAAYARVHHLESAMSRAIDDRRFLPFLALHETEAWVLAAVEQLAQMLDVPKILGELNPQVSKCGGPELVDNGPETAPSKRILKVCPAYRKVNDGPDAIELLGLADLRTACPHLHEWLRTLEGRITRCE